MKSFEKLYQLNGTRILELASVLAGPAVGQFFAELGAEVIKVENLRTAGDVTRTWKSAGEETDDRSAYFCSVNWGKRSIAIDLNSAAGKDIVHKLAKQSDIVIASYKPGDAERLQVDYKTLSQDHPGLIYGQITGYGSSNARVGYDAIIQAEAGFMYMNGLPGGPSLKMPVALIDVLAGHHMKEGLLLAMLEKARTGQGQLVEVSLIQSAVSSLVNQATNWLIAGKLPTKHGSAHPNIAPYGEVFRCADGVEVILAVGSDQQFQSLCRGLGVSDLPSNPSFVTNSARVQNRQLLYPLLAAPMEKTDSGTLLAELHRLNVPAGAIQNLAQVMEMPESRAMLMSGSGLTGVRSIAFGPFTDLPSHFPPPPHFGEHTLPILSEKLDFSESELKKLLTERVIA